MKTRLLALTSILTLVGMIAFGCATQSQEKLRNRARVSEADARATALSQVPGGTITEGELEEEHGLLIWSFDIRATGKPGVTEVQVNALTGKIARVEQESEAQEKAGKTK